MRWVRASGDHRALRSCWRFEWRAAPQRLHPASSHNCTDAMVADQRICSVADLSLPKARSACRRMGTAAS